jgi:hypothetical protein
MDLREKGYEDVNWTKIDQDISNGRPRFSVLFNFQIPLSQHSFKSAPPKLWSAKVIYAARCIIKNKRQLNVQVDTAHLLGRGMMRATWQQLL